jgi:CRP-like cAMP-binding protein
MNRGCPSHTEPPHEQQILERLFVRIPRLRERWEEFRPMFAEARVPARHVLLREGAVARRIIIVLEGCLRASVQSRGRDITTQFFVENEMVASFESFRAGIPSPISITTVEASTLRFLGRKQFDVLLETFPEMKDVLLDIALRRFEDYSRLFVAYLHTTPRERYDALLRERPDLVQRVPQRYLASYLGITPVSLSRIRAAR